MECIRMIKSPKSYSGIELFIAESISIFDTEDYMKIVTSKNVYADFPKILDLREGYRPLKLYKYTPLNIHSRDALSGLVYFSLPTQLRNDKLEVPISSDIVKEIFGDDLNEQTKIHFYKEVLKDIAVISCFSENPDNTNMWFNYASENLGFCIEYDTSLLFKLGSHWSFRDDTIWGEMYANEGIAHLLSLFPVIYSKNVYYPRELGILFQTYYGIDRISYKIDATDLLRKIIPAFLVKKIEWSPEKEWRLIWSRAMFYENALFNPKNNCIDLSSCITKVILGGNANEQTRSNVCAVAKKLKYAVTQRVIDMDINRHKEVEIYSP